MFLDRVGSSSDRLSRKDHWKTKIGSFHPMNGVVSIKGLDLAHA
jgi:hypothetical protein